MMKQSQIAQCWLRCLTHITEILSKRHLKKESHFARDNKLSDTTQAIGSFVESYLDHSNISRIKIPYLHLLTIVLEQTQKKCLHFWEHLTQSCWF